MKYDKKVLCLKNYNNRLWTPGVVYDASKDLDGSWSVKTNLNEVIVHGILDGGWGAQDSFGESFSDITKEATLLDAVRLAYNKGYFTITDKDGYGCVGVHCETPSNGFYISEQQVGEEKSAEEYVKSVGELGICQNIAKTIVGLIESGIFSDEAALYLMEMKDVCAVNGKCAVEDAIEEWLSKAERGCERDN